MNHSNLKESEIDQRNLLNASLKSVLPTIKAIAEKYRGKRMQLATSNYSKEFREFEAEAMKAVNGKFSNVFFRFWISYNSIEMEVRTLSGQREVLSIAAISRDVPHIMTEVFDIKVENLRHDYTLEEVQTVFRQIASLEEQARQLRSQYFYFAN